MLSHDIRTRIWFKIRMSKYIPCTPETRTTYSNIHSFFYSWTTQESTLLVRRTVTDCYRYTGKREWTLTTFIDKTPNHFYSCLVFRFSTPHPSPIRQFETIQHICISYNGTEKAPSKIEIPENLTRKMERQLFISPKNKRDMYMSSRSQNRSISICLFLFTSSAKTLQYVYIICVAACIARHSASVLMVVVIATPHHIFPQPPPCPVCFHSDV